MSIKTKRNLGGIAIFVSIVLIVWMMTAIILPQFVMSGNDIISFLLLIVLFGVVGLYLIFATINNYEIKHTIMHYSVRILAGMYTGVLLYVMILSRLFDGCFGRASRGYGYDFNFIPLKSIVNMILMVINKELNSGIMIENFVGNIIMFLPMVVFLKIILKEKYGEYMCLIVSFVICIILEIVQCITYCGAFDIDDILLNTIGIVMGYLLTKTLLYKKVIHKLYISNK